VDKGTFAVSHCGKKLEKSSTKLERAAEIAVLHGAPARLSSAPAPAPAPHLLPLSWSFLFRVETPNWASCFHSCYIQHNAAVLDSINVRWLQYVNTLPCVITVNVPRYIIYLQRGYINLENSEYEHYIHETNTLKSQRGRLIRTLKKFDDAYRAPYYRHEVSCMFFTLTRVPYARHTIRSFLAAYKKCLMRAGVDLLGYVWCSEVSYEGEMGKTGGHWHYHLMISLRRINVAGGHLPEVLSLPYTTKLWGQRAKGTFICGGNACMRYMREYSSKKKTGVVLGVRRYGTSREYRMA